MSSSLFQVDLTGVLKVLSDSLYSSYQVFIRELLQNSVDAINARKRLDEFAPSISVCFYDEDGIRTLTIEDNGIGLTLDEVEQFLSKIGSSSKSSGRMDRDTFIGQFGIGLLSCFMVSDEVTVISKSAKGAAPVKWVGNIKGTYRKEELSDDIGTGTTVFLKIREDILLDTELMEELLHRYGDYLQFPIQWLYNGTERKQFHKAFPWEGKEGEKVVLKFGKERFGEEFYNYIPLSDRSGKTRGIAYIIPRNTHFGTVSAHQVYVKKMFITDKSAEILPDWAFFVRAVVNSDNLSPTASREEIYKNSKLEEVREELGGCIKEHLRNLSLTNPETLSLILRIHNEALKSLALKDEEFFSFISSWFLFYTSEGLMNMNEIRKKTKTILYVSDIDQFRQILPVARANQQLIVNGGYIYDTQILRQLEATDKTALYKCVDVEYYGNILTDLSIEEYDGVRDRILSLQYHMETFSCELEIKKFMPDTLPAIFYMSEKSLLERDITTIKKEADDVWDGVTDAVFNFSHQYHSKLFLNCNNPMVKKLLARNDSDTDRLFIEMIYVNSLMLGHYPLNSAELEVMNGNLLKLLDKVI